MTTRDHSTRFHPDSLRKILELERSTGFRNKAVVGGLDAFLKLQARELAPLAGDGDPGGLLDVTYGDLTPRDRAAWAQRWLSRLDDGPRAAPTEPPPEAPAGPSEDGPSGSGPEPGAGAEASDSNKGVAPSGPVSGPTLESPVDRLRGVDTKTAAKLDRLGVYTVRDLLYLMPRRHRDFSKVSTVAELVPGEEQTVVATVWEAREIALGQSRRRGTEAVFSDETGNVRAVWFGNRYVAKTLKVGARVAVSGSVEAYRGRLQFASPEFEVLDRKDSLIHTGRLVPVYPLTEGLTARRVRTIVWQALEDWAPRIEEFLPEELRRRAGLMDLAPAVRQVHYPSDLATLEEARRRLAFDELLLLQIAVLARRRSWREDVEGVALGLDRGLVDHFIASLPFGLTAAQKRCIDEVLDDLARGTPPMNRLLQGEVGSGKTVVALAALLASVAGGHQASIMVPTEVLAEQHFATVSDLLAGLGSAVHEENLVSVHVDSRAEPLSVGLLTGSTRPALKRELRKRASEGRLDIVIGTHALIQEGVEVPRLALAVTDEQHRFGVAQRAALRRKGETTPHVLVMTATPIPRTLALTLYGDLDISTIDELPPGRQQVRTRHVPSSRRDEAYDFVRKQVIGGRQAFIICPLIEESEAVEARAASEEHKRLSNDVFPDLRLGLLHGRMKPREKERVMRSFRDGDTDILVSTAVVEVGIDVPNATVMVVEGAHRFGLSQLHQFRGRVGRGEHRSYCLLLSEYSTAEAQERLDAVERIHDGFALAEEDLRLRGPGDFFGTRQSGLPSLKAARLSDQDILRKAREVAGQVLEEDPDLERPDHRRLALEVARFVAQAGEGAQP